MITRGAITVITNQECLVHVVCGACWLASTLNFHLNLQHRPQRNAQSLGEKCKIIFEAGMLGQKLPTRDGVVVISKMFLTIIVDNNNKNNNNSANNNANKYFNTLNKSTNTRLHYVALIFTPGFPMALKTCFIKRENILLVIISSSSPTATVASKTVLSSSPGVSEVISSSLDSSTQKSVSKVLLRLLMFYEIQMTSKFISVVSRER
ncbi:hypothetical protein HELRODRAFT_167862 [Helobdella robusta]|uniref:Uncharacterized protein n=1 Tax=Helobdella robusta TaxID=6412 RepID=T1EZW3_HELRO|nr:hypothetical protein HELRODRAFT_167862 [Helobdella robusta]ESO10025.1 hypothetical protein HELRODRAFT_167862 [Helobdella robusta]